MAKKRFVYKCKCGKEPLRGTFSVDPAKEAALMDCVDRAWAESHNQPGCGLKSKEVVAIQPRTKAKTSAA